MLGRSRSIELGARTTWGFVEATVTLEIVRTFRGTASSPVRFVDSSSVSVYRDPYTGKDTIEFAGGSGACGTLDDYPVGRYVLIALSRGEDSRWHASRLYGAIYIDQPDYAMYRWLLERHGVAVPDHGTSHRRRRLRDRPRTLQGHQIPRSSSESVTSRRRAKWASAASEGATRPVSIFHTYCRSK